MSTREEGRSEPPAGRPVAVVPGLTVAAVARRLGVAPSTLRTWDRRYGLGPSAHAPGTHRRYTPADLHRLTMMRRMTLEGVPPAEAAELVAGRTGEPRLATVTALRDGSSGRGGGGRVVRMTDADPKVRGLARAAMALDSFEMSRLLRESVHEIGIAQTWEQLAVPVLIAIGERWARLGESVDVEHSLSEALLGVLHTAAVPAAPVAANRAVMLVCAEGDGHTLPLYVLAAALSEHGVRTRMLGSGLPADALLAAVRRTGPTVVFVLATLPVGGGGAVLELLPRQRPAPYVVVGGRGWDHASLPGTVRRVTSLTGALDEILGAVQL